MKPLRLLAALGGAILLLGAAPALPPGAAQFDAQGNLLFPADYRDWVFLSSGLDMSYAAGPAADSHVFDNVFAPRAAYDGFLKDGVWPDKTVLMMEIRAGATDVSINKRGVVQTGNVLVQEAHVKDVARFKGGWGFFIFDGDKPASMVPTDRSCYSCHQANAAADTTFVQFYPTLLPVATRLGTLNPAYVAATRHAP